MITDDEAKQFLDTLKKICKAEPNKQLQQVNLNLQFLILFDYLA